MCQCCHEISLGKDKQCDSCGEFRHITLFQKPKLLYSDQYASDPEGLKHYCHSCKCVLQQGHWHIHLQTKKHRLRTYVELLADEYQGEYKSEVDELDGNVTSGLPRPLVTETTCS
jgi:hypothetical protein